MLKKLIKVPYVPKIDSELDVRNIDRVFTREMPRETPESNETLL